jgi:hypothetical protein
VILCFRRRPKPHAGFLGAVGFARCLSGFARGGQGAGIGFLSSA